MILVVSSWFNEEGYDFSFSHKVDNLIRDEIRKNILIPYKLNEVDKDYYLNLVVATSSETKELEVRGPDVRKRAKFIDFGLWLPYSKIVNSDYPLREYINYYFEAARVVFSNYNVPKEAFDEIQQAVKSEVLNNKEYEAIDDE